MSPWRPAALGATTSAGWPRRPSAGRERCRWVLLPAAQERRQGPVWRLLVKSYRSLCVGPRTSLPARQCPGELANCILMLLVPDLGKIAGDLELHTLVERDQPRTFIPDTVVKIGDRRAQRAGDLK